MSEGGDMAERKPVSPEKGTPEWPKEISTTMEPNRRYSVGEAEYRDLKAVRILKEEN